MKKSRLTLVAFWLLMVSATLVGVCGREFYFTGTSLHLARWPLLAFLLLSVYAFYRQNRRTLFAISAATLLLLAYETLWTHALKAQPTAPGTESGIPLRALSYNICFVDQGTAQTLEVISREDVDVAVFQEVTPKWEALLRKKLSARFPFSHFKTHQGTHGMAIFSRYPLEDVRILNNSHGRAIAQCATLLSDVGNTDICNVHLASPAVALASKESLLPGLHENEALRRKQWHQVLSEMNRRTSRSQLVAGDFNTMEWEPLYENITRDFVDVCRESQFAPPGTFPNVERFPVTLRIDYIFARGWLVPGRCTSARDGNSDHHPITAKMLQIPWTSASRETQPLFPLSMAPHEVGH